MAPLTRLDQNPKAAGRARKEEKVEKGKQAEKAKVAAVEDEEWSKGAKGAKGKVVDKAASAAEAQARKDAARKQLEEEEANAPKAKAPPAKKTPAKAAAAPKPKPIAVPDFADGLEPAVESFGASGIVRTVVLGRWEGLGWLTPLPQQDDALDLLQLVNEKTDKAATGSRAAQVVELHPERKASPEQTFWSQAVHLD